MSDSFLTVRNTSFGRLTNLLTHHLNQEMEKRLAEKGLNIKLFGVIMILMAEDKITQIEISKRIRVPGYATSRTLDQLEKIDLIERTPDPSSRRSFLIVLTDKGRELGKTLPAIVKEVNHKMLAPLEEEERTQLLASLQKVVNTLTS